LSVASGLPPLIGGKGLLSDAIMETLVREVAGIEVVSMHHDISTVTGEEVVLFTLAETPLARETKRG
jgi:uncharacterized protein YbcI